jgi:hypothetical protein
MFCRLIIVAEIFTVAVWCGVLGVTLVPEQLLQVVRQLGATTIALA